MSENNEMNSIIHQAKSEARADSIKQFFTLNRKIITVAAILSLVVVVGFVVFDAFQTSQEKKFSAVLQQSTIDQQEGNLDKAKNSLQEVVDSGLTPRNIKALATLRLAALLLDENKKPEAVALYQQVNQCRTCDAYLKDLAGLLTVRVWLSDENEIQKDDLLARIEKIESNSKELRYQITEQKGWFELIKNNLDKSYAIFESLAKNPEADEALKKRAGEAMKIVVSNGYEVKAKEASN
ncbi:MAG: tetratricopeptide repeat protein [Rickettsiales bacterium]|nr:tetratricopeptide repeat protein [Rickettsiales bacterium]